MSISEQVELTPEQERYAAEHGATLFVRCPDDFAVCAYREQPDKTVRWIVSPTGHLLEHTTFARV
jgi:hypothetical protein